MNESYTMRKLIMLMWLVVVSGSSAAAWVKVGTSHTKDHGYRYAYVDPSSIRKSGDMPRMLDLLDFEDAQHFFKPAGGTLRYLSKRGQSEYDCKNKRWRQIDFSLFAGNMGKGKVVYASHGAPGPWHTAPSGSAFESRLIFACGKN
jgi:hypothetical protein